MVYATTINSEASYNKKKLNSYVVALGAGSQNFEGIYHIKSRVHSTSENMGLSMVSNFVWNQIWPVCEEKEFYNLKNVLYCVEGMSLTPCIEFSFCTSQRNENSVLAQLWWNWNFLNFTYSDIFPLSIVISFSSF